MPRRQKDLSESFVASCILKAMQRLHDRGERLLGPSIIGIEARHDYGKPIVSTHVSTYLRRLVDEGIVSRQSQGGRRGLYRLVYKEEGV